MTAVSITTDFAGMELPELIGSIQWEFEKAEKAAETALCHGINCGHALNAAKQKVPHGSWMKWIEDNTTIPHSTVNMFMMLASNSQRVENSESIRGALKLLADGKAEVRRRQISETYIPYDGESAPAPAPPPAPRQPPTPRQPSAPITLEAEIVEPHPPTPATVSDKLPKWIPDDAERLWLLAKIDLDKILKEDESRERVLNEVIAYCHGRLDQKRDALAAIIGTLPRLTKDEIKTLIETLNTRWT